MNREKIIGLVLLLAALAATVALCLGTRAGTAAGSMEAPAEEAPEETWEPLPTVQPPRPPQPGETAQEPRNTRRTSTGPLKNLAAVLDSPADDDPEAPAVRVTYGAADMEPQAADRDAAGSLGAAADMEVQTADRTIDTAGEPGGTAGDTGDAANETMVFLGEYQIYGYDICLSCCGKIDGITDSGTTATVGRTAACASLPHGTRVYIEGIGERVIEDTGGLASDVIDVLCADHAGCYAVTGKRAVYQITGQAA